MKEKEKKHPKGAISSLYKAVLCLNQRLFWCLYRLKR